MRDSVIYNVQLILENEEKTKEELLNDPISIQTDFSTQEIEKFQQIIISLIIDDSKNFGDFLFFDSIRSARDILTWR